MNKTETENGVKRFSNTEIRYIFQIADSDSPIAPVHSHTFYEILYVLRGGCTQYINENEYSMNAGMLLILSPGDIHGFKKKEKDTEVLCLSVSRDEFIKYEYLFGRSFPALTMEQMQNSIKVNPSTAQLLLCFCNDLSLFSMTIVCGVCVPFSSALTRMPIGESQRLSPKHCSSLRPVCLPKLLF